MLGRRDYPRLTGLHAPAVVIASDRHRQRHTHWCRLTTWWWLSTTQQGDREMGIEQHIEKTPRPPPYASA
ncbi:hypothetical protein NITMOv2_4090 [Nitrospira moscoviensis]|uniref:Uncharacterized protein n=1 Tax=Nitrospira moscoviensis TaxID=42253 RepID=A0A0K2GIN9_NITMO|nr:hypothetical protein NITMOv2_4090 [Nitrospira moscoviensis]